MTLSGYDARISDEMESGLFASGVLAIDQQGNRIRCLVPDLNTIPERLQMWIQDPEPVDSTIDWVNAWLDSGGYTAALTQHFVVATPDQYMQEQTQSIIILDPRDAFGNGLHPTTRLCAQAIEDCVSATTKSLFDFGTGTGILSILGTRLGISHVVACDIDEKSRLKATQNLAQNGCLNAQVVADEWPLLSTRFDLIVANMVIPELLPNLLNLVQMLAPEGKLILSGYRADGQAPIANALGPNRIRMGYSDLEGWICEVFS